MNKPPNLTETHINRRLGQGKEQRDKRLKPSSDFHILQLSVSVKKQVITVNPQRYKRIIQTRFFLPRNRSQISSDALQEAFNDNLIKTNDTFFLKKRKHLR